MPGPPSSSEPTGHPSAAWRSRPLFICSTFVDMHAERDYLRVHVFDVLAERLRARQHYLETIDLRQGVEAAPEDDVARRELKVLKVCLDEIKRSHPFFIGLIGDRYGWVPPEERMQAAADDAGFAADVRKRSITELEILYGVLESPDQLSRSWFYIRELDYDGMPDEVRARFDERHAGDPEAQNRARSLEALKQRLTRELPERVRTYRARWDASGGPYGSVVELESLAEAALEDLWSDIDAETRTWLRGAPSSWQEAELQSLEAFVEDRTRGFVERPSVLAPLLELALSPSVNETPWGLCLTGESGGGKSSIFGQLYKQLRARDDVLVLSNAAGVYPRSGSVDHMLRRWIHELAAFLGQANPLGDELAANGAGAPVGSSLRATLTASDLVPIEDVFSSLLGKAAHQVRVVILLDALNQSERTMRAEYLTWLPKPWPDNVRLIATAIPGIESETLAQRPGATTLPLLRMTAAEARDIALNFYRMRYHREPNPRVLDVLLTKRLPDGQLACGNPLWLELSLQEMNLLRADDYVRAEMDFPNLDGTARIVALQVREANRLDPGVANVYSKLLDRAEADFGQRWTRAVLTLIALGRSGWREDDLATLTEQMTAQPWDDLAFAGVRRTLGHHLVQRGAHAQWDAFHAELREAILHRGITSVAERRRLHGRIADHLLMLPRNDPLRITESMVHLIGTRDPARIVRQFASPDDSSAELRESAAVLASHAASGREGADFVAGLLRAPGLTLTELSLALTSLLFDGASALEREAAVADRVKIVRAWVDAVESRAGDGSDILLRRGLSVGHRLMGDTLREFGDLDRALTEYDEAQRLAEALLQSDPANAVTTRDVGVLCLRIGTVKRELGELGCALDDFRRFRDISRRLARDYSESTLFLADLSVAADAIADVLVTQGRLGDALIAYRESKRIRERLAACEPANTQLQRDLSVSCDNIGDVLEKQGELTEALAAYQESLIPLERLVAQDPSNDEWQMDASLALQRIARTMLAQGDLSTALTAAGDSLDIATRVAGRDPSNMRYQDRLATCQQVLGSTMLAQGALDAALTELGAALKTRNRAGAPSASLLMDISEVYRAQGKLGLSLKASQDAVKIAESAVNADPTDMSQLRQLGVLHNQVGEMFRLLGQSDESLEAHRLALDIAERLVKHDKTNVQWLRDTTVAQTRIGDALFLQERLDEALEVYQRAVAIRESLSDRDPSNTDWSRDLVTGYSKIGDVSYWQAHNADALAAYNRSLARAENLTSHDPLNATWRRDVAMCHGRIGNVLTRQHEATEARESYERCAAILTALAQEYPTDADCLHNLAVTLHQLAGLARQLDAGDAAARQYERRCRDTLRAMKAGGMHVVPALENLLAKLEGTC